jgi:glycosyltransferase 2 family protein
MKKAKPVVVLLLKLLVSAGLLGYFLTRIHVERFLQTLATAKVSYVVTAMMVYLVTQGISAMRWTALARPLGIKTPFNAMLRYYLIGMFFNLFGPSTVGGDVSRVYYLVRDEDARAQGHSVTTVHATMSVLMDRAIGMVVLVWLGAAGLLLFPDYAVPHTARIATFLLALGLLAGALITPLLRRLLPEDGHHLVVKLRLAFRAYRTHWRALVNASLFSLAIHLVQAWMHVVMGSALGLNVPFSFAIIIYPLVGTFAAIPISLNGLGLREGGYIFLLAVIGIGTEKGIAFGILLFLVVAFDSLIGGLVFLLQQGSKPADVVPEGRERIHS